MAPPSGEKGKGSIMRISEVFAMGGGGGRRHDSCRDGGDCDRGCDVFDDPRLRRRGLAEIIGSTSDGGSGLLGIFS
jgi:hypothetical protein